MGNPIIKIQPTGIGTPIFSFTNEEQLFISAKAYDLKFNQEIHRLSLYSFVQTHLSNKSEENLQKTLETSNKFWTGLGNGMYSITKAGQCELDKYSTHNTILSRTSLFSFWKKVEDDTIRITVNPITGKYDRLTVNGVKRKSNEIVELIQRHSSYPIPTNKTSLPRKIHNWLLCTNDYSWKIH